MRSFSLVCLISLVFKTELGQLFIFWIFLNVILFQETKLNCEISITKLVVVVVNDVPFL